MFDCLAPIALRTPISLVRSLTETSMMFMMPIPPTSKLIAAIPVRSRPRVAVIVPTAAIREAWLVIVYRAAVSGPRPYLSLSNTSA